MIGVGAAVLVLLLVTATLLVRRARSRGRILVPAVAGAGVSVAQPSSALGAHTLSPVSAAAPRAPSSLGTTAASSPAGAHGRALVGGRSDIGLWVELARPVTDGTPGWRHDPDGRPDHIRYFDGRAWTDFYARKIAVLDVAVGS